MLPRAPTECDAVKSLCDAMLAPELFGKTFAGPKFAACAR